MAVGPFPFASIQAPLRSFLMRHPAISLFTQGGLALGALATAGPMLQRVMTQGSSSLLSSRVLSRLTGGYLLWEVATVIHQLSQTRIGFSERALREFGIGASGHFQQSPRSSRHESFGRGGFEERPLPPPQHLTYERTGSASAWEHARELEGASHEASGAGLHAHRFCPHPLLTERQLLLKAPVLRFVVLPGLRSASSVLSSTLSAAKSFVPYVAKKGCRGMAISCLFVSTVSGKIGNFFNRLAGHRDLSQ